MSAFLASVQSLQEARIALEQGADVIDLKRPATGVLGAVSSELALEIARFVGGQCTLSATIGDLPCAPDLLAPAVKRMLAAGVDIVKVGVFEPQPSATWWFELQRLCAQGSKITAVLFADRAPQWRLLQRGAESGLYGIMLDTAAKEEGSLRDWLEDTQIGEFIRRAQGLGLRAGLAGSLGVDDISSLLSLKPDYLGFRSALCHRRDRIAAIEASLVARVRRQIPRERCGFLVANASKSVRR